MQGTSEFKIREQDKQLFEWIENYNCHGITCDSCPYYISVASTNIGFCTLAYISNRLISARESEG